MKTIFLRVLEAEDKAEALLQVLREPERARGWRLFEVDPRSFGNIRRSPFAYWVSEGVRRLFKELPPFAKEERQATVGLQSSDDFRFLRLWWESAGTQEFVSFAKGGKFSPYYADVFLSVLWNSDGREIKTFAASTPGTTHWSRNIRSIDQYFRPGLTWPRRTNGLSVRVLPAECIFSEKAPTVFVANDDSCQLLALAAVMNSSAFRLLVALQLARTELAQSFEAGLIQTTPMPDLSSTEMYMLAGLARRAWSLKRDLDAATETSHAFALPSLLRVEGKTFTARSVAWTEYVSSTEADLVKIQTNIDERCFVIYGIDESDRRGVTEGFQSDAVEPTEMDEVGDDEDNEDGYIAVGAASLAAGLVSWAVGIALGRFDLRLATSVRALPSEPDPFDPLPACSPAMLTNDEPTHVESSLAEYSFAFSESSILVSDLGHPLDISRNVRSVLDAVFGEDSDKWWTDLGAALGAKGGEVRAWLNRDFFDYHLKTYSRSRRKAPILWPIGTRSGSYLVWLYAHNVSADSLFGVLNDLLVPKLFVEERALIQLRQEAGTSPTASQRKAIDIQERLLGELREFRELLEAVAPLWAPDLNDGIILVLAPLWRLFAHHRAWSTELRKRWVKLAKGDYDWAQLAMHLWPERVVAKCGEDRSIAIAHGLEDVFWVEDPTHEDKWIRRAAPVVPIEELVARHRNPAISAALERMGSQ